MQAEIEAMKYVEWLIPTPIDADAEHVLAQSFARALLTARNQGRDEDSAWPAEAEYSYGQPVEKFTGEAQWDGVIVSAYYTTAGKLRYVVEVKPQGFQMIAVPSQLRAKIGEHENE
ncbi:MAG: hypothetical protein CML24_11705 [Rhizobiales bacterium]|nr:hypothetical protein [Hyphomicrobiales bacterium]